MALAITMKVGDRFKVGPDVEVVVSSIDRGRVRVAVTAPREVPILRDGAKRRTPSLPESKGEPPCP